MWTREGETTTTVAPDVISETWTVAGNRPKFDEMMEYVELSPFAEGTTGTINGPLSGLWGRIIRKDIAAGLPSRLVALAALAGKKSAG